MIRENFLKLFTNCQIVIGKNRAIVCDLQRNKYVFIPNSLASLFDGQGLLNVNLTKKQLDKESITVFNDYLELLDKYEFVFPCSKKESNNFPLMSLEFDYPAIISNIIVDYDKNSHHDFQFLIDKFFIPSNCRYVQIRCYDEVNLDFLDNIIKSINSSFIKAVDFIVKASYIFSYEEIAKWMSSNKKIRSLTLHSSKENKIIQEENYGFSVLVAIKQEITSQNHCGIVHNSFNLNIEAYTESQNYNSCLNRKLSIDIKGDIKNCPSMRESFGNIKDTTLGDALNHPNFKKYWNITKDQIDVCKDCEFRHICTDCRAYTENPKDLYSKPLKCGYNPYTNVWEEWSTNPLKQKAIKHYGMQELIIKENA